MTTPAVMRIGDGVYRVAIDGLVQTVFVAGPVEDRWAFFNGEVFRTTSVPAQARPQPGCPDGTPLALSAPMPARVVKVLAVPGASVVQGDTLVILEAMKMELPLLAPRAAKVAAVHCREGELVQSDTVLVELE